MLEVKAQSDVFNFVYQFKNDAAEKAIENIELQVRNV
jgi:hypothetical protein